MPLLSSMHHPAKHVANPVGHLAAEHPGVVKIGRAGWFAKGVVYVIAGLLALAVGAGSITFSHFSDSGFWMFKEYFNLSIRQTLATWTMMEILIGFVGLAGVLLEHALLGPP